MLEKILLFFTCSPILFATTILYDFRDISQVGAIEGGQYKVGGVLMTLSSPDGALNQTSSGFGINHSGGGLDDTDQIDGDNGAETLQFSFDEAGVLEKLQFSSLGSGDTFELSLNGQFILEVIDQGAQDAIDMNVTFSAGETMSLKFLTGNGASLDSLSIGVVPEPSSSTFLGIVLLSLIFLRKRGVNFSL